MHRYSAIVKICAVLLAFQGLSAIGQQTHASEPLISVDALAKTIQKDANSLRVLDVSSHAKYANGHIAGAVWGPIGDWKSKSTSDKGLDDLKYWASQLGNCGIESKTHVVVAGDSVTNAARCWWLLKYLGVEEVQILDGGTAAWKSAGKSVTDTIPKVATTTPKLKPRPKLLAQLDQVSGETSQAQCTVIDTRSQAEFTGQRVSGPRGGHIPGAKHLEWKLFVGADGKFLSAEKIKDTLKKADVDLKSTVVTHCQSGARSSVVFLALELAGVDDVKNYYRGWSEYSSAESAPVEK